MPDTTTFEESNVRIGLARAFWAKRDSNGAYSDIHEFKWPEQCNVSNGSSSSSSIYAGDKPRYNSGGGTNKSMDVQMTKFDRDFLSACCGYKIEDAATGGISNVGGKASEFAFGYETTGDQGSIRTWYFCCTSTDPVHSAQTNTDSIQEDPETATFTASKVKCGDGVERYNVTFEPGDAGYDKAFEAVPFQQAA